MNVLLKRPSLRWLAPAVVVLAVSTAGLVGTRASADTTLSDISAQDLLVKVAQANPKGLSGTVEESANLGLPSLGTDQSSSDFSSLISGTHTLRVAYAAPDKARFAVHGSLGESDLVTSGTEQWLWSSEKNTVTHRTGAAVKDRTSPENTDTPMTPSEAAAKAFAAVGSTTDVTLAKNVTVAGRPSYELVLRPKASQTGTKIESVRLAVDGTTFVPLRVQLLARGVSDPVFSTAFTTIDYAVPAASEFSFTAPKDAKVTEVTGDAKGSHPQPDHTTGVEKQKAPDVKKVGSAWTTVVVMKVPSDATAQAGQGHEARQLAQALNSLPKVSGTWGSGKLLSGTAFSAVLTDDGRLAVGAVTPALLYAALS
ncbi:MAG: LolA family protein [Propionibacteriaceae bacterium]